ncbi:MAG: hypothetical protein AAFX87_02935 [Bacteroidota bacterium]
MNKIATLLCIAIMPVLMSATPKADKFTPDEIEGLWKRDGDELIISFSKVTRKTVGGNAFIVNPAISELHCELLKNPVYSEVKFAGENKWTCHYMTVDIVSCSEAFNVNGIITLLDDSRMLIRCPGVETLYFSRIRPRY